MRDQLFPWARTDDLTLGLLKQLNGDFVIRMSELEWPSIQEALKVMRVRFNYS